MTVVTNILQEQQALGRSITLLPIIQQVNVHKTCRDAKSCVSDHRHSRAFLETQHFASLHFATGLPGAVVAAVGVDAQQDEQQEGEAPQRGAAVAEEREADTRVREPVGDNENVEDDLNADLRGQSDTEQLSEFIL